MLVKGLLGLGVLLFGASGFPAERNELDLAAVRAQSPIPAWCDSNPQRVGWPAGRGASRGAFCRELGQGYAALATQPQAAIEHAKRAMQMLPNEAGAVLLQAQGQGALGDYSSAWQGFQHAQQLSGFRLPHVHGMHQFARAARLGGGPPAVSESTTAYRQLLAVSAEYQDKAWRVSAAVEAALAFLDAGASGLESAAQVIEDTARFADSSQFPQIVRALQRLLEDWQGARPQDTVESNWVYPEALQVELALSTQSAPKLRDLDRAVLLASSWEHWDPAQARERWLAVAEQSQSGAWGTHAAQRARLLAR